MKYLWPLAALLCIDAASAETLLGKYIQRADRPICNPHAAQPVADGWSLALALPRDCAVVSVRNPVFTWTRKKGLRWDFYTATFELRDASNNIVYSTTTPDTRLILPQDLPLSSYAAGSNAVYSWTVSYTDYDGTVFKSAPRRFTIRSGAEYIATEAQIVEAAKGRVHPRALTRSGPANQIYDVYANQIARGDRSVELSAALAVTRAEMDHSSAYWPDTDDKLGENVANERRAIETLGHLYFILRNNSPAQALVYLEKCRARLLALKDWPNDPTALTHQAHNDQANREAFLALALGWDIFKAQEVKALGENYSLSGQQLDDIKRVALERIGLAIEGAGSKVGFKSLRTAPFNSHVISATHYATEALMYLVDPADTIDEKDNPQGTASRLAWSWRTMVTSVGTWGGTSDGGFGNGSNYAWYSMGKNARTLAAVKLITGRNLTEFAPIGAIGMNIVAQTPPAEGTHFHHQMGTFGDGAEIDDHMMNYGGSDFRLLAYASELPIYEWYWRTSPSVTAPKNRCCHMHFSRLPGRPTVRSRSWPCRIRSCSRMQATSRSIPTPRNPTEPVFISAQAHRERPAMVRRTTTPLSSFPRERIYSSIAASMAPGLMNTSHSGPAIRCRKTR
nr:hypothetical protein [Massilia sp. YMA4]